MTSVSSTTRSARTQRTVLIVDGHDGVRAALAHRLEREPGIRAVAAVATLDAALRLTGELLPDIVVCDPKTLATNPTETVRRLAAQGAPVVVFTSSLRDGESAGLESAGAAAQLLKGSSITELIATIEVVIGARTALGPPSVRAQTMRPI